MAQYDKDDLQSVLLYMRNRFGFEVFEKPERMFAIISDLSPKMKPDGNILRQLSEAGLLQEMFAASETDDMLNQSRVLIKLRDRLTNYLFITDERATHYIAVLKAVYGLESDASRPQSAPTPNAVIVKSGVTGDCAWTLDGDGVLTISGNGNMGNYTYSRKSPWLNNAKDIRSIIVEHGVIGLGERAFGESFHECKNLTSIRIPDSVTSIGDYAFQYCNTPTSIRIPDSVTSIGKGAFQHCKNLTSIRIPNSVTSIASSAFWHCLSLTSFDVSSENPCYSALDGVLFDKRQTTLCCYPANKKGDSYMIPDSVTRIGGYAFAWCGNLTSVYIPDSVTNTSIESSTFYFCSSLTSIRIPDSVTSIEHSAFRGCSSLTSVSIPDSVTSIGHFAFSNCSSLTSVRIPDSVTSIGDYAFNDCSSLTNVRIPDSVTSIGHLTFKGCNSLTSVSVPRNAEISPVAFEKHTTVMRR